MDIKLDTNTHDAVIEQYDLVLVEGIDLIRQRLKQRFWFFLGEWFLATNEGVPYFQEILVKGPDRARVESILKQVILQTEGVESLTEFALEYDNEIRRLTLTFACTSSEGEIEMEVLL